MSEEVAIGYVYILENDSMPGLIKIGRTSRDSAERARELSSTTGVPTPFKVAFELPSAEYEQLEGAIHNRLAGYRVTSNREFFKYPVNKAISLLKKLNTEKQGGIRSEIITGKKNLVNRVSNFFQRFFRPEPDKLNRIERNDREPTEVETIEEFVKPTPPVIPPKSSVDYIIKDRVLQNEYRDNVVDVNLNDGEPYYSEQNGFYWAANHQGITECVPQHIKRIIHNEELEIASTRDELEQEINYLREETTELEKQKREYEQEIAQRTQELAEKKEGLAGLEVRLKTLTITGTESSSIETILNDSNPELFNASDIGDPLDSPVIKGLEENSSVGEEENRTCPT